MSNPNRTGLSKSKYTRYCQCRKSLWLQKYKPEEASEDASREAVFERGNAIGDLAMGMFGDFVEVTTLNSDGSLDLASMTEKTRVLIDEGCPVICEASFCYENKSRIENFGAILNQSEGSPWIKQRIRSNYCAVDILKKTATGWSIYEVKSSTSDSEDDAKGNPKADKYVPDIAYQRWVLEKCGVNVTGTYLVCIDSDYVLDGKLDIKQLFKIIDMGDKVATHIGKVSRGVHEAHGVLQKATEPDVDISENCMSPYPCDFWEYCSRQHNIPEKSVFNMYRMPFKKKIAYYNAGCISFDELQGEPLSSIQLLQLKYGGENSDEVGFIDRQGIADFLKQLTYPLYFLDFETMQLALPEFQGTSPYQQIPFQYSLHYINHEGGELQHTAFLGVSGQDPRRALAEQLCRDIPRDVCTIAYNKGFECGRIRELAAAFPDLADHLLNIERNIVDLLVPFQQGCYYLPAMGGSFSIKKVLPALFPDDPELDYHNLDSRVQNGGDAMTIYPQIKDMTPEEQAATHQALLEYCKLDTLAMVKIWQKLVELIR